MNAVADENERRCTWCGWKESLHVGEDFASHPFKPGTRGPQKRKEENGMNTTATITRFDDFNDADHAFQIWWQKHGQYMMSGGGGRESIWAARGWIAREQLLCGAEVTGESLHEESLREDGGKRKHPLKFVQGHGKLMEALGIARDDALGKAIEDAVEIAIRDGWNMRRLFEAVGEMEISDELWANFLYTYGWWDGGRS